MSRHSIRVPIVTASDAVDVDFCEYYSDEHKELHKKVRERKYTVKNTDVTYRVINHWDEKEILPDGSVSSPDGWRKFSLVELLWLHAVKKFREFGLPLETIKKIKELVLMWDAASESYNDWFEYYAMKSKTSSMDGYIVASPDGNAALAFSRQLESAKTVFGSRTFIQVSFKELWSEMGLTSPNPEGLFSLSKEEVDIVHTIRNVT